MATTTDPTTRDTVSDLFNYDVPDDDDPFGDLDTSLRASDDKPTLSPRAIKRKANADKENDGLGLDEEVKIAKKRKPVPKLDEARLLSHPGIPKLRTLAQPHQIFKKLLLKGKGHEYSDAARLLDYYQMWLDNLYPRAKFADGLQLVEKIGHSKRMQAMRREWIDEGKPGYARDKRPLRNLGGDDHIDVEKDIPSNEASRKDDDQRRSVDKTRDPSLRNGDYSDDLFFAETRKSRIDQDENEDGPREDELDQLLTEQEQVPATTYSKPAVVDSEGEDDLDALLAEQASRKPTANLTTNMETTTRKKPMPFDDEDGDDFDAFLAAQDTIATTANYNLDTTSQPADAGEEEEDDLDALLAEQDALQSRKNDKNRRDSHLQSTRTTPADSLPETHKSDAIAPQAEEDIDLADISLPSSSPLEPISEHGGDDFANDSD